MNEGFALQPLIQEIERYLAAVETFRAEECEPTWQPEPERSGSPTIVRLAAFAKPASQPAR